MERLVEKEWAGRLDLPSSTHSHQGELTADTRRLELIPLAVLQFVKGGIVSPRVARYLSQVLAILAVNLGIVFIARNRTSTLQLQYTKSQARDHRARVAQVVLYVYLGVIAILAIGVSCSQGASPPFGARRLMRRYYQICPSPPSHLGDTATVHRDLVRSCTVLTLR